MTDLVTVGKAREFVLSEGALPTGLDLELGVREEVLLSWRRSLMSGARIDSPELPYVGEVDSATALCRAADPVLSRLAERLAGLDAGILIADRHARIIKRWVSDKNILGMLDRLKSDAGFTVNEELVGTNGVGTVAETGKPIQIIGPEHLCDAMVNFACVGVPVRNPISRRLEGVITMSCRAEAGSALLTPLMMSAAADVEHRLLEQASLRERAVLDAYLEASRGGTRRVAGIGEDIFIAGPRVTQMLEGLGQTVLWGTVQDAIGGGTRAVHEFRIGDGRLVTIDCEPIRENGRVIGALVDFGSPSSERSLRMTAARSRGVAVHGMVGVSTSWGESVRAARRAAAARLPMLAIGEVTTGKFSLLSAVMCEEHSIQAGEIQVLDCAGPEWDSPQSAAGLVRAAHDSQAKAVIFRHIEALRPHAAATVSSALADWVGDCSAPHLAATMTSATGVANTEELRRIMDILGAGRVDVAALRERSEDIVPIAEALLAGQRRSSISVGAARALTRAPWPGNVGQLRSVLLGVVSGGSGSIALEELPSDVQASATRRNLTTLEQVELRAILDALKQAGGNKVLAAKIVGVSRSTLYRKLHSYRIDPDAQYF